MVSGRTNCLIILADAFKTFIQSCQSSASVFVNYLMPSNEREAAYEYVGLFWD